MKPSLASQRLLRFWLLVSLVLWLLPFGLHAQAIEIEAETGTEIEPLVLGPDIPYGVLRDASGRLTHEDVAALPNSAFDWRDTLLSESYRNEAYWLRLHLPAAAFKDGERWLEVFPPFLDDLRLFHRPSGSQQPWQQEQAGDRWPAAERSIQYRYFVFVLPPPEPDPEHQPVGMDLLIRIQTRSALLLEGKFWTPQAFFNQASRSTAYWSFYLGLGALSTLLAIAITLILRTRAMLAVTSFSVSYLFLASIQGFSQWLLFSGWPIWFVDHHTSAANFAINISMLWVGREALQLPRFYPWLDRVYLAMMALMALLLLSIPLGFYGPAAKLMFVLSEPGKIGLVVIALRLWIKQGLEYGLIGLVYALFTASSLTAILTVIGLIPLLPGFYLFWQNLLVILMLLVMGISVHRVAKENRALQDKEGLMRVLKAERDASFQQRQFLGMVSHEFRSPLSVIALAANNLSLDPPLDQEELDQRANKIQRATRRLAQLTDNCLADARLGGQLKTLERQPYHLCRLMEEACEIVALSESHQLHLWLDGEPARLDPASMACTLDGDPALLRIALSNLLDNAVKYSPPGVIDLRVWCRPEAIHLQVASRGTPIPPALTATLFERYVKGGRAQGHRGATGAGLGLYIAREILRAHGGELTLVASNATETLFDMCLPISREQTAP